MNQKLSYVIKDEVDIFNNKGKWKKTYKWPLEKGGSEEEKNEILLSQESINHIQGLSKGKVNGIKFAVRQERSKEGFIYGVFMIKIDEEWIVI